MAHHARLEFSFPFPIASAVHGALLPEGAGEASGNTPKSRARFELSQEGTLVLHLEADDLPTLRAVVNAHVRWVDAAAKAAALGV